MWINYEEIRRLSDTIRELGGDDDDTFLDTLDGETDAMEIMGSLIKERQELKAFEEAAKKLAADYTTRAKRMSAKQDAIAQVLGHLLDAMDMKKVQHPLGTVSRTKPRQSVLVTDENDIPTQLMKVKKTPDLAEIKKQLDAGEFVPGVEIKLGHHGVTIRTK